MKKSNQVRKTGLGVTQFHVIIGNSEEWKIIFDRLTELNYTVIGLSKDEPPIQPNVICVDEKERKVFQTSVTCLACSTKVSKPLTATEYLCKKNG